MVLVSAAAKASKYWSFDEFCTVVNDDRKADLIDGAIYMASPDNTAAADLYLWLIRLMSDYLELRDLGGRLYGPRVAFRLNGRNSPEPDIAYVRHERLHLVHSGFIQGPPDLAIEIVSPDSVERDYIKKRGLYQRFGVLEYWILDEVHERATFLHLGKNGVFQKQKLRKGIFQSRAFFGFWLKPSWLWQKPLPRKADVLAMILAENGNNK